MEILILGTGCPKCRSLEKAVKDTVADLGIQANVSKEEDIIQIMTFGVLQTPGLVIDNKVVVSGRIPTKKELKDLLTK